MNPTLSRAATAAPDGRGTIVIDERCTACGLCIATCPEHALKRAPARPHLIARRCTNCLACIEVCPVDAITEYSMAPIESHILGPRPVNAGLQNHNDAGQRIACREHRPQ